MNKLIVLGMLASSMIFYTACDSSDVVSGAIGVGIGIGIGSHDRDRDRDRWERDRRDRDRWGRSGDRWGRGDRRDDRWGRGGRGDQRRCGPYGCYAADSGLNTVAAEKVQSSADFAKKYGISSAASDKIQTAFAEVETKGIASFQSIGLDSSALKDIAKREVPSEQALNAMGENLGMSAAQSKDFVKSLITEFNAQASDVNSDYWQSCMADGKWKTAQNNYCTNAEWQGCSPQTGATVCY